MSLITNGYEPPFCLTYKRKKRVGDFHVIDTPTEIIKFIKALYCPVCKDSLISEDKTFKIGNSYESSANCLEHYGITFCWDFIDKIQIESETVLFFVNNTKYDIILPRVDAGIYDAGIARISIFSLQEDESYPQKPDVEFQTKCRYFDLSKFTPERFAQKIEKIRLLK